MSKMISIAKDFSDVPWGRVPADGDFCGENFREQKLLPALRASKDKIIVDLDGVEGLGSSFLEEAFGGLVWNGHFTADELRGRLEITTTQPEYEMYRDLIWQYIAAGKPTGSRQFAHA